MCELGDSDVSLSACDLAATSGGGTDTSSIRAGARVGSSRSFESSVIGGPVCTARLSLYETESDVTVIMACRRSCPIAARILGGGGDLLPVAVMCCFGACASAASGGGMAAP